MNLYDSGCTNSNRKLKGFTLIEVLIVMAIIAILAGIMSVIVAGFRRDAEIEAQNNNAQMVFTAFQDALINCEINQDLSMFDVRNELSDPTVDVTGAILFFRISDLAASGKANVSGSTGIGDEIHIMTSYSKAVPNGGIGGQPNVASGSVWAAGTTQNVSSEPGYNNYSTDKNGNVDGGASLWEKWNTAIAGRIDPSMEGTYCVMIDLLDYEVRSVICRNLVEGKDPKTGLYDTSETESGKDLQRFAEQADSVTPIGGSAVTLPCRVYFIKPIGSAGNESTNQALKKIASDTGMFVGCYPFRENVYSSVS